MKVKQKDIKQTFSVNIGGRAYNIDADAYELLDRYLKDIASRLRGADAESMDDIEARVAEIFGERISSEMQVVGVDMVRRAMAVIGRPEVFGSAGGGRNSGAGSSQQREFTYQSRDTAGTSGRREGARYPDGSHRLTRSPDDKMIGGVCGGLAEYFDVDPVIVRLIALVGLLFAGSTLLAYVILWIVVPMAPKTKKL